MGIQIHAVEQVLSEVAFEAIDRYQSRTDERFHIGLAEYTEEWHVAASGAVARNELVAVDVDLEFSMDFFTAPEQRRGDLTMPTFVFGSYQNEVDSPTFVVATAAVRLWTQRDDGAFTGCKVAVGVHLPGEPGPLVDFDMLFHLSFTGWGAPFDAETGESTDPGVDPP